MKALLCEEPGRLSLVTRPRPVRGAGEVLVRIRHVGVCGTDFHIFAGKHPFLQYPRVMGHELSGTVEEADDLAPGTPVYIVPYLSCGTCAACRKGLSNACRTIRVLGVHTDGGMAEYLSVPAANVIPAGNVPLADAAMIEFLAIGAHGVKRGGIGPQDRVLVTGAGPIGMSAIFFAKTRGAHVTVMDPRADRLAFASTALDGDAVLAAGPDALAEAMAATGG
ncbi:MAG: alcohol dehydrogenase catalytic domain-containing protein, partial [Mangrovicoccus sp.]|nr:alcohol dehydrogenase catalytic domain-containing protein [Mangrovicoccus sp.]